MDHQSPELQPYLHLHGATEHVHPEAGPCFVREGRFLVGSALEAHREGRLRVLSVLGTPRALAALDLPEGVAALAAEEAELSGLLGFAFHRGLLCCVRRPEEPPEEVLTACRRLLVLPHVDNVENLGLLMRSAAALGVDGVLVGRGPQPFARRSVRVSMGAAWSLPLWQREDLLPLLARWQAEGGEVVGAALDPRAEDARAWHPAPRTALVLGPEAYGLDAAWRARCDRLVAIPMARGIDSLNVAAAGAILLFRMTGG